MIARYEGKIVGSIVLELDEEAKTGGFGMLVVDPKLRGLRVGSQLVGASEDWARAHGCKQMKLGLLTPKGWAHPDKVRLNAWYTRIGYVKQKTFTTLHKNWPHLVNDLTCECICLLYTSPSPRDRQKSRMPSSA